MSFEGSRYFWVVARDSWPGQGSTCERQFVDGGAFEGVVGVQVLARGVEIRVSHEVLDGDDVAPFLKEARRIGVTELVQRGVLDASPFCDSFESAE